MSPRKKAAPKKTTKKKVTKKAVAAKVQPLKEGVTPEVEKEEPAVLNKEVPKVPEKKKRSHAAIMRDMRLNKKT